MASPGLNLTELDALPVEGHKLEARPVLKWAGGKRQLLPELLARAPAEIATYYEPFIEDGALFFELANQKRFQRAIIGDANQELVNLYAVVRDRVRELIGELRIYENTEDAFYRVRAWRPTKEIERAARTVYLNKTAFNGLYRVNKKGEFNTPFGRYKKPNFCDEPALLAASEALRGVTIQQGDFEAAIEGANPGDFIYLDPPYLPVSTTSNFAAYHADGFNADETERLCRRCRYMARRGIAFLASNSHTSLTLKIFDGLKIDTVSARRNINSKGGKRGAISEILVSAPTECRATRAGKAG